MPHGCPEVTTRSIRQILPDARGVTGVCHFPPAKTQSNRTQKLAAQALSGVCRSSQREEDGASRRVFVCAGGFSFYSRSRLWGVGQEEVPGSHSFGEPGWPPARRPTATTGRRPGLAGGSDGCRLDGVRKPFGRSRMLAFVFNDRGITPSRDCRSTTRVGF